MAEKLVKSWQDWSAGIGHPVDDGRTPGMAYAAGLLGLKNELRPAPFFTTVQQYQSMWRDPDSSTKKFAIAAISIRPFDAPVEAIAFDAASDSGVTGNTALTFAHTVGAGANRYLTVGISTTDGNDPSGVTYDGVAMTKLTSASSGTDVTASWWGLIDPNSGSNNVVVTLGEAEDIVAGALSWSKARQAHANDDAAFVSSESGTTGTAPSPYMASVATSGSGAVLCVSADNEATNTDIGNDEDTRWQRYQNSAVRGRGSSRVPISGYHAQYMLEEAATSDANVPFLYALRGNKNGDTVRLTKIILGNTDFAKMIGDHEFATLSKPGQPARYQGKWIFPAAATTIARELTTVGTGSVTTDTLTGPTSVAIACADHLTNIGFQLAGHRSGSGVRILQVDGDPKLEADWGEYFPVGDKEERAGGLRGLEGLTFVMNVEGLYSFNSKGRSRLVFEDFRAWRNVFDNIPVSAWRGGLLIPHPSGLLYYVPGEQPVNVGVDRGQGTLALPPSGVTELHGGYYHSTTIAGDFIFAAYQPDPASQSGLILVAYSGRGDPADLVWQGLGTVTFNDANFMTGTYVAVNGRPLSATTTRPTLWFVEGTELRYMVLDPRASPFRSRADVHKVTLSAEAYMSELEFSAPVDLTKIVVWTSEDMIEGDEWQISIIADGTGKEKNVSTVKGSGIRHPRKVDRHAVSRMVLHVKWTGTSAADRVPPVIKRIDLYGDFETAGAE